jgi:predicted amidophosphoribosyltransferase
MAAGKRQGSARYRLGRRAGRCSVCRKHKDRVHRNRVSGRLVCATCGDRSRLRVGSCSACAERKVIQARGRCYACYKREWRFMRERGPMARAARHLRRAAHRS